MKIGQPYTSGTWMVKEGNEEEFIARWTQFTEWSLASAAGAEHFVLIRDTASPRHFLSFGAWENIDAVHAWKATPEFQARLDACRALCDEFSGTEHVLAAAVGL